MSINRSIPALFQGVSQQPAAIRALDQVEALENGYPTVSEGDRKRPPTEHVAFLGDNTPENAKVHQYFRGDGEHVVFVFSHDTPNSRGLLLAFDGETGVEKTVDISDTDALAYIDSANAIDELGCLTVADTTFVWNKTRTVATKASTITAPVPTLFYFVKEAIQNSDYSVNLGAFGSVAVNSGTSAPSTVAVALQLKNGIQALAGSPFTVTQNGSLLTIRRTNNSDFQFEAYDSSGGSLVSAFKNRVERYSDLPRYFVEGITVQVQGEADLTGKSAFWVRFNKNADTEIGWWEETVAPNVGEPTEFDPTTMPVKIVRQADGTFKLQKIEWNERLVGSTATSCPVPSFVGGKINSLFFYRNRLGLLSGENVVLSRANDLFNLWPKTAMEVLDDDPIDVTANSTRVANLRHAIPFQRTLVLFSDNAQFVLTGGEVLTPKTARLDQATEFDCSSTVTPVSSGQDLFFVYERASSGATYSGMREYFINQAAVTNDAVDVSAHVPQYIPKDVYRASVSSTENLVLLLTKNEWNRVYFYKYLWDGEKKVQSAWGRWTFRDNDKVLSAEIDKTRVYLVIQRWDGLWLETMNLQPTATTGDLPFQIMLDSLAADDRSVIPAPVYDATTDITIVQRPYSTIPSDGEVVIVAGAGNGAGSGSILTKVGTLGANGVKLRGKWDTGGPIYFGIRYAHRTTLSEQFMRDTNGNAIQQGRLQMKHITVAFKDAVSFYAEVSTPGRDVSVYRYSALQLGIIGSIIGSPVIRSGSWTFPVASRSTLATITLINDSPYPATFYAAEWEGEFNTRSQRK